MALCRLRVRLGSDGWPASCPQSLPEADLAPCATDFGLGPIAEATPTRQGRQLPDRQYCVAVPIRRQNESSFSFPLLRAHEDSSTSRCACCGRCRKVRLHPIEPEGAI